MSFMIKWGKNSAYVLTIGRRLPWCRCVHFIYLIKEYYDDATLSMTYADYVFGLFRRD